MGDAVDMKTMDKSELIKNGLLKVIIDTNMEKLNELLKSVGNEQEGRDTELPKGENPEPMNKDNDLEKEKVEEEVIVTETSKKIREITDFTSTYVNKICPNGKCSRRFCKYDYLERRGACPIDKSETPISLFRKILTDVLSTLVPTVF